jgi:hypothetical protein
MSVKVFISTVSTEFLAYRERLRKMLTGQKVEVKIQEDFKATGGETLEMLDDYISGCDAVVHRRRDDRRLSRAARAARAE